MKILKLWNWESPTTTLILLFGVVAEIVIPLFQLAQIVIPAGGNRYLSWRKSLAEQNYRFHYGIPVISLMAETFRVQSNLPRPSAYRQIVNTVEYGVLVILILINILII